MSEPIDPADVPAPRDGQYDAAWREAVDGLREKWGPMPPDLSVPPWPDDVVQAELSARRIPDPSRDAFARLEREVELARLAREGDHG